MKRRLAAACTVVAMLAAAIAPAHPWAAPARPAGPGPDVCIAGAKRAPPAPPDDGHVLPCNDCAGCVAGAAAPPAVDAAAPALPGGARTSVSASPVGPPAVRLHPPSARGPPARG